METRKRGWMAITGTPMVEEGEVKAQLLRAHARELREMIDALESAPNDAPNLLEALEARVRKMRRVYEGL